MSADTATATSEQAFTAFYIAKEGWVTSYLGKRMLVDGHRSFERHQDVEDVAADVWMKVWRFWDRFDDTRGIDRGAWLMVIAHSLWVSWIRKRSTHPTAGLSERHSDLSVPDSCESTAALIDLRAAFGQLKAKHRQILTRRVRDGGVDKSNSTERVYLYRARNQLALLLGGDHAAARQSYRERERRHDQKESRRLS